VLTYCRLGCLQGHMRVSQRPAQHRGEAAGRGDGGQLDPVQPANNTSVAEHGICCSATAINSAGVTKHVVGDSLSGL
jgi:hypothetical protein